MVFRHARVVCKNFHGQAVKGNPDIIKDIEGLESSAVGSGYPDPEFLLPFGFHIFMLVEFITKPDTKYDKTCKKGELHI